MPGDFAGGDRVVIRVWDQDVRGEIIEVQQRGRREWFKVHAKAPVIAPTGRVLPDFDAWYEAHEMTKEQQTR